MDTGSHVMLILLQDRDEDGHVIPAGGDGIDHIGFTGAGASSLNMLIDPGCTVLSAKKKEKDKLILVTSYIAVTLMDTSLRSATGSEGHLFTVVLIQEVFLFHLPLSLQFFNREYIRHLGILLPPTQKYHCHKTDKDDDSYNRLYQDSQKPDNEDNNQHPHLHESIICLCAYESFSSAHNQAIV